MKRCSVCRVEKPREFFYRRNKDRDWISAECIECKRLRGTDPLYRERRRELENLPEAKAKQHRRNHSPAAKAKRKAYDQSPAAKLAAQERQRSDAYKLRHRDRRLRNKYGISVSEYDSMLAAQGGHCALCPSTDPGAILSFHVDHCHRTKKVRGLLCVNCNTMLGHAGDEPARLRAAAAYIERHRT